MVLSMMVASLSTLLSVGGLGVSLEVMCGNTVTAIIAPIDLLVIQA
jgi:hypothetical protein